MDIAIHSISMEVASGCNFNCKYCYHGEITTSKNMTTEIADKALEFFFESAKKNGLNTLRSIGFMGGEPLLNFKLIKYIVEKCKEYEKTDHITVGNFTIITNGSLLTDEIIEYSDKNNIFIRISLDGNKDVHNFNRTSKDGTDNYNKIIKSIKKIKPSKCAIGATITHKSTPDCSQKVIEPIEKIGAMNYSLGLATSLDRDIVLSMDEAINNAKEQVSSAFENIIKGKKIKNLVILEILANLLSNTSKERCCGAGTYYVAICYDGKIVPCHRSFGEKESSIGSVFNGLDNEKIQIYKNATTETRKECKKCSIRYLCTAHCYYNSLTFFNDINKVTPLICAHTKTLIYETYRSLFNLKRNNLETYNKLILEICDSFMKKDDKTNNDFIPTEKMTPLESIKKTIHLNCIFVKNTAAEVIDIDEEGILFLNSTPGNRYIANTIAMAIWDILDGTCTVREIVQEIAGLCMAEPSEIEEDIIQQLAMFKDLGFVEEVKKSVEAAI